MCENHWIDEGNDCGTCPGNWDPAEDCNACLGNWDSSQNCEVCQNHWIDEGNDCGTCPANWDVADDCDECLGNWDIDQSCEVCQNHWIDEGNDCGTCPGNWNAAEDCDVCLGHWDSTQNCEFCLHHWIDEGNDCGTCPGSWDPAVNCNACLGNWDEDENCEVCENHWIDEDNDCGTCPSYWDPSSACNECLGNYDLEQDCAECIGADDPATIVCGNGLVQRGEHCDDCNDVDFDGCDECEIREIRVTNGAQMEFWAVEFPAVDMTDDGAFVVSWADKASDYYVKALRFDEAGLPVGHIIDVSTESETSAPRTNVGIAGDGSFIVLWPCHSSPHNLLARRYGANGEPLGDPFIVAESEWLSAPAIAMAESGEYVLAWRASSGLYAGRYDAAGEALGDPIQVVSTTSLEEGSPQISASASGAFVVTWYTGAVEDGTADVFARRFSSAGAPLGDPFSVNTFTEGNQCNPDVAVREDGAFTVTWQSEGQDGSGWGVYARRFGADGSPTSEEFQINSSVAGDQKDPRAAVTPDGRLTIVWTHLSMSYKFYDIFTARFAANGVMLSTENPTARYATRELSTPGIATAANGRQIVLWQSSYIIDDGQLPMDDFDTVFVQRVDPQGNLLGDAPWDLFR